MFLQTVSGALQAVSSGRGSLWGLPALAPVLPWGTRGAEAAALVYAVSLTPVDIGEVLAAAGEVEEAEVLLAPSEVERLPGRTPSSRREWGCGPCTVHRPP